MNLKLQEMTIKEKLRTMELLWDDICRKVPDLASPHGMEIY
ncbi:conserved domain protein [delta proteobacterium NaphS2]|nr:conserved domain protein [delta proteobacterium NaphS2]